ncbi:MAG: glycosyltransferase family 4 protein [Pseudomonadota bacterium]
MRILYSHRTRSTDGQFVHIDALTHAMHGLGHELLICGPEGVHGFGQRSSTMTDAGFDTSVRRRTTPTMPPAAKELAELSYNGWAAQRLLRAAVRFKPDIIYERYNLFFHAGAWVARAMNLPRLLEVNAPLAVERAQHGSLTLKGMARWSEGRLWRHADAVLPVSKVLGEHLISAGVAPDRVHIVPNGVDEDVLTPVHAHPIRAQYGLTDHLVLGFVGFVREWHGVDRVLHWMATDDGYAARLLIVGDGPAVPGLKVLANRLGVADRLVITGVVERSAVPGHIAAFDIALQPAATDYASPLKLQEYMAQSRSILAPRQANIMEALTHDKTAWLFHPEADDQFAMGLSYLAQNAEVRDRLGAAARTYLLERDLTWTANARRVTQLAEALVNRR